MIFCRYRQNGVAEDCKRAFLINPVFACTQGIVDVYYNYKFLDFCGLPGRQTFCDQFGYDPQENYFSMKGIQTLGRRSTTTHCLLECIACNPYLICAHLLRLLLLCARRIHCRSSHAHSLASLFSHSWLIVHRE